MIKYQLAALAVAAALAACGGGGGVNDDNPPSAAQGLWIGSTNSNRAVTGLVFSDGTYYVLYSSVGQPSTIAGVVQGTSSASGGSWSSGNARDFNLEGLGVNSATVSGSYTAGDSLSGAISYSGGTVTSFTSSYDAAYDITPTLTTLAGTYTGQVALSVGVQSATVTISGTGVVSANAQGCGATGTAAPRSDGNAYNFTLTFGGSPCFFAGQTFSGVAYLNAASGTLYAAAPNSARTDGVLLLATRP